MRKVIWIALLLLLGISARAQETTYPNKIKTNTEFKGEVQTDKPVNMKDTLRVDSLKGIKIGTIVLTSQDGSLLVDGKDAAVSIETDSLSNYAILKEDSTGFDSGNYFTHYQFYNIAQSTDIVRLANSRRYNGGRILGPLVGNNTYNGTTTLTSQILYLTLYVPTQDMVVDTVSFATSTTVTFTGSNYNGIGIWERSGTTLTRIDSTANDEAIWKGTANTMVHWPLVTAVTLHAGTDYYVGWIYSGGATAPNLYSFVQSAACINNWIMGTTIKPTAYLITQSHLTSPLQMSGLTAGTVSAAIFLH